jgi:hypothetical protein
MECGRFWSFKMKTIRFAFYFLSTGFIYALGCSAPKPAPAPLSGWRYLLHVGHSHLDRAIVDDYWDYIHRLPLEEEKLIGKYSIDEFEDTTGQHAVKIEIPLRGTYWEHVIIYDQNNKRTKVMKYKGGRYRS